MGGRLVFAIISTMFEETAIAVIVLWGLPRIGIDMPLWGLVLLMMAWLTYTVTTYRMGSRALRKEQVAGLPSMVGTKGMVVSPIAPEGLVRIKGELWVAKSVDGQMEAGGEVIVVAQDRLKLIVRDSSTADDMEEAG
jgi:membrane-bound ClpP family serine protease